MIFSSQNVFTLSAQHGQKITVSAQDLGLILDASRNVPLVEQLALSNDCISQLNRGAVEKYHIDPICLEGTSQFIGEVSLDAPYISIALYQRRQIVVTHGTQIAIEL
jgi:hypothetical protein